VIRFVAGGLVVAAIAGGVTFGVLGGGASPPRHTEHARPHAHRYRDGPVHGLMLLPLADPDGRKPTASSDR
jgi:hypothetical protein